MRLAIASQEQDQIRGKLVWANERGRRAVVASADYGNAVNLKVAGIVAYKGTRGQFSATRFDPNRASPPESTGSGAW